MRIRPAVAAETSQIVELVTRILTQEFPEDQVAYSMEDLERLGETYGAPGCTFLVAEVGGRVVGTCGVKADGTQTAVLRRLFVDPSHRAQGIGTQLLRQAVAFCRQQGFREAVIRTSSRMEKAIRLCRGLGFEEDGRWRLGEVTLVRYQMKLL